MVNLQNLLETIDQLPTDMLEQIEQRIEQRREGLKPQRPDDPEAWIAELHAALAAFREGLSEEKLNEIVVSMNIGYESPKELNILARLADELPEIGD